MTQEALKSILKNSDNFVFLTGAGISEESGICWLFPTSFIFTITFINYCLTIETKVVEYIFISKRITFNMIDTSKIFKFLSYLLIYIYNQLKINDLKDKI